MSGIRCTIWVVDDDRTYQDFISAYLTTLDYQVRCFSSGEECLKYLNDKPDVIILDHNLESEVNGVDVLRMIKEGQPDITVIYISGQEKISLLSDAFLNGSEDFIEKDSASLIRLKIKLEEIHMHKMLKVKQRKKQIVTVAISAIVFMTMLSLLYYFLACR